MITSTGDLKKGLTQRLLKLLSQKPYSPKINLTTRMRLGLTLGLLD